MQKELEGNFEKVDYDNDASFVFYRNQEYESYPSHWHTAAEIIIPVENLYTAICGKHVFSLKEGDIMIIPPGELHELIAPPTGKRLIIQFDPAPLNSIRGLSDVLPMIETCRHITQEKFPELHETLKHIFLEISSEYEQQEPLYRAAIYGKLIEVYVLLARSSMDTENLFPDVKMNKQKEYVEKFNTVFQYISRHYSEELSLDDIAGIAGFSKFHFSRLFKKFTNQSFYDYLNQKRVKEAEMLLLNPDLSITEVAMRAGFSSISTFNRVFKTMKSCTPSEYKSLYYIKIHMMQ